MSKDKPAGTDELSLKEAISVNPGSPEFVVLGEFYRSAQRHLEALGVLLSGLSASPGNHKGRLLLARVFFELGAMPFAVRELKELSLALPENKPLQTLLEKLAPEEASSADLGPTSSDQPAAQGETVAEADFTFDDIELVAKK